MNKKGEMDTMKLLGIIIITLILLGISLYFINKSKEGGNSFVDVMQGSLKDYDGDEIPNAKDECPCGSPENRQDLKEHIDGVAKCVQQYGECSEKSLEYGFETITDQRGRTACVYHRSQCAQLIENDESE